MLLMKGSKGPKVEELQRYLGMSTIDGDYGPATERAVIDFQKKRGLQPDGIVGTITLNKLKELSGNKTTIEDLIPGDILPYLDEIFHLFKINSKKRKAMFLAQCAHESANFSRLTENLNYSREALLRVFGKYFNEGNVDSYANQPEKIANRVYGSRMGNGDEASGDGWRYRGRGVIQLTGRNNYVLYGSVSDPDSISTLPDALYSSARYWMFNDLNAFADKDDILRASKLINLGNPNSSISPNGLTDRVNKYVMYKEVL